MRFARLSFVLALLFGGFGGATVLRAQSADPIAQLEAARQADPENVAALRALGIAYFKQERFAEASVVLEQARTLAPNDGVSALYAGMSAERVPNYTIARAAYDQYLGLKRPWYSFRASRTEKQVRNRLIALAREESIERAKAAVAAEAQLSATPGDPRTIAVPAMKYSGPHPAELSPLERGLAELIITDLGKSPQLVIVERDRMQAIADEIQLGASGRVDSASAVRAGHLIQAGRLVNGALIEAGQTLTLSSSIVTVSTAAISSPAQVTGSQDTFFDMQKELVFRIFDQLSVTLSAAERAAIGEHQTKNFDAFLMYSRGLVAADAGRFEDARRFFERARAMDPAFSAATTQASIAEAALSGSQVTATTLESSLPSAERMAVTASVSGVVPPVVAPPIFLIPGIPSFLRLPPVPPSPLGSTLAMTAQGVNPPTVSPITNAATRSLLPSAPIFDPTSNVMGMDRLMMVIVLLKLP